MVIILLLPLKKPLDAGTSRAAVEGWFAFLKPLSIGSHELKLRGDVDRIDQFGQPTDEDRHNYVLYKLHIKP